MSELPPTAQAIKDFQGGGGLDDNPYPKGTDDHEAYMWKMAELWNRELEDLRLEIAGGV